MPTEHDIRAKLEELAEVRNAAEVTRLDYEAKRAEILRSVQAELDALQAEYEPLLESAQARAEALEAEIKKAVLEYGATVKGSAYQAVYVRGRVTWDNQKLERYAQAHPEILVWRREGEPSVALRAVKQ
ncbi:MAG: hypothetical protein NZM11_09195 [Anaerolineales bacterium]|nr:hypothetical protein [Anaerolineales bacterium]